MARRSWFALTVVVAATCLALSAWQFGRRADRRAQNAEALQGRTLPLVELGSPADTQPRNQRRVRIRGEFDSGREFILRGHLLMGAPGVQVVTPLRLAGSDSAVLVNRGFVPAADGATPDAPVPGEPGEVVIEGIAIPVPDAEAGGQPAGPAGRESWRRLDLEAIRGRLPYPILDVYVLAAPDSGRSGWPRRVPPPSLDEGPHLSYALQWLGIAGAVLGFGMFFVLGVGRREGPDPGIPAPPARP